MIKDKLISGACITVVIFLAPYILTLLLQPGSPTANAVTPTTQSSKYTIVIENNEVNEDISLEEYLVGVVAAEMPASFEKEALKAQAVAARTYALKRLTDVSKLDADSIGQSYLTTDKMRELWGDNYLTYFSKIEAAVNDTKGEVAEYNDELIDAVFHSTSAGKTQGASEVWGKGYDYLAAVESEGDITSPEYLDVRTYTNDEVKNMVKNKVGDFDITTEKIITSLQIISRNDSGYVTKMQLGNKSFTGEEFRNIMDLNSSNFYFDEIEDKVRITCKGYGHGVGMSQYGANAMALEGKSYVDIIKHYYTGVEIATVEN
jgi:stage II sporulation protein D